MNIHLTFQEALLGTVPKNQNVYAKYIQSKAAEQSDEIQAELDSVEHLEEQGWTGFHTEEGKPFILDYQIKGFFKDACGCLSRAEGTLSGKLKAYKKIIDGLIFVKPRKLFLNLSGPLTLVERPLRASTPQGERICLARSDAAPAGTTLDFAIQYMELKPTKKDDLPKLEDVIKEWLDYGSLRGLGQWRNSGSGAFTYKIL